MKPVRLAFVLLIATATAAPAREICLCFKCLTGQFRHYIMPSGSMIPALPVGSCFSVRLRAKGDGVPEPGAIIAYQPIGRVEPFVARVIAVAGQTVEMRAGLLSLDGVPVQVIDAEPYRVQAGSLKDTGILWCTPDSDGICAIARETEVLPNGTSYDILDQSSGSPGDDVGPFLVPDGHVFVMGDNRDNALDSRFSIPVGGPGMVEIGQIIGTFDQFLNPPPTLPAPPSP